MYALLSHFYYWPNMEDEIEAYVKTCEIYQLDKPERQKEERLLQPLHIVEKPRVSISMDFIFGFPKVNGLSSVLVVVDRFLKYTIFINAPHLCTIKLFFQNVVKYFGLPEEIISDCDARFIGRF